MSSLQASLPVLMGLLLSLEPARVETGPNVHLTLECDPVRAKDPNPFSYPSNPMNPFETLEASHRLFGTASFYSAFLTAAGPPMETLIGMRDSRLFTSLFRWASWSRLSSSRRAKRVEVKVTDRGPYSGGFVIDLSQAAAEAIGVARATDRRVRIHLLAAGLTGPQNRKSRKGGRRTSRSSQGEGHAEPATLPER